MPSTDESATTTFRGFLFRLGPPDNNGALSGNTTISVITKEALRVWEGDDENVRLASTVCITNEQVGGLTHTSSVEKPSATGLLRMDDPAENLLLDVTVVVRNQGTDSIFYYTQYALNAVEAAADDLSSEGDSDSSNSSASHSLVRSIVTRTLVVVVAALVGSSSLVL